MAPSSPHPYVSKVYIILSPSHSLLKEQVLPLSRGGYSNLHSSSSYILLTKLVLNQPSSMAITAATSVSNSSLLTEGTQISKIGGDHTRAFAKSPRHINLQGSSHGGDLLGRRKQSSTGHSFLKFSKTTLWHVCGKPRVSFFTRVPSIICFQNTTETQECTGCNGNSSSVSKRAQDSEDKDHHPMIPDRTTIQPNPRLADACQFIHNDAKFVNERARNDIFLLSRGIMSMDERARQDVAIIGSEFLKLDARARKDTEKFDTNVKKKAERLHHIAMILKEKAGSKLKKAADKHWSDGALEADLRRADFFAKQRALGDALTALEFVKNIHDMMVTEMYKLKRDSSSSSSSSNRSQGHITIEKNGKMHNFFPGEVSTDRITAIEEAYLSMASAFYEADGIDYTDPEELELLVATLIDLDAMDGKSSVSLLAECSNSPDENTRKALANALATAPSMWTLGNAGMGALQRLAEDSNPSIARAASRAIVELEKQWEIEEGDSWRFMMNQEDLGNNKGTDTENGTMN